jgi:hypothetical protein
MQPKFHRIPSMLIQWGKKMTAGQRAGLRRVVFQPSPFLKRVPASIEDPSIWENVRVWR